MHSVEKGYCQSVSLRFVARNLSSQAKESGQQRFLKNKKLLQFFSVRNKYVNSKYQMTQQQNSPPHSYTLKSTRIAYENVMLRTRTYSIMTSQIRLVLCRYPCSIALRTFLLRFRMHSAQVCLVFPLVSDSIKCLGQKKTNF